MNTKNTLFKLSGKVQHYQWGGYTFIPALLGIPNNEAKPFAEYWLGAHDNYPSAVIGAEPSFLNVHIQEDPGVLGKQVKQQFGRLPYLLKVLDVKDMLSIQVHPSRKMAVLEFEKENKAGISLQDAKRNYKDDNHKPELMLALSDFWLLHGFKSEEGIREVIRAVKEFNFMLPLFDEGGYEKLYRTVMEMEQEKVNEILQPLLDRIIPLYTSDALQKNRADFWAARAAGTFKQPGIIDRGIFSVYLLNLVTLQKGEAIFQDAGVLHAYLEGQNMEIMANSDNVLRGGLTPKHIDVAELMKHVDFSATIPVVIKGTKIDDVEEVYFSPSADFQLSRLLLPTEQSTAITAATTEVFFLLAGVIEMKEGDNEGLRLEKGDAAVAFACADITIHCKVNAELFRATVPLDA
ncbi:MAG: mannose-6-phosphate isomerase, class I [Chitinophagaceae bacterium]